MWRSDLQCKYYSFKEKEFDLNALASDELESITNKAIHQKLHIFLWSKVNLNQTNIMFKTDVKFP